ncbi:MAG: hypothetical protein IJ302_08405, partial [Clostridia bacterium]|nr:hypothetical protein [Clostridia bacterium]
RSADAQYLRSYDGASFVRDGMLYAESHAGYYCFDAAGTLAGTIALPVTGVPHPDNAEELLYPYRCLLLEDGSFLVMVNLSDEVSAIYRVLSDGTVHGMYEMPAEFIRNQSFGWGSRGDTAYILQANRFSVFDAETMRESAVFTLSGEYGSRLQVLSDGTVVVGANTHTLNIVDTATGGCTPYPFEGLPDALAGAHVVFDCAEVMYCATSTGVYSSADGYTDMCVTWANGGVNYTNVSNLLIFNAQSMLYYDTQLRRVNTVSVLEETQIEPRRIITLANESADNEGFIADLVHGFNTTNEEYYIEYVNYKDRHTGLSGDELVRWMQMDFVAGNAPDLIIGMALMARDSLGTQDALVDLAPHIGDRVLGGIADGSTVNGRMASVPLGFTAELLAVRDTVLSPQAAAALSLEDLYAMAETLGEGEALFSEPRTAEYLYTVGIRRFIDAANADCSFDTEEFRTFIRFLARAEEEYTDPSLGRVCGVFANSNDRLLTDPALRDHLASGRLKFMNMTIRGAESFCALKMLMSEEPFSLCGFTDNTAFANGFYEICVNADSTVRGGCLAFLEYALSYDVQMSARLTELFMPVTKEALSAFLAEAENYVYERNSADLQDYWNTFVFDWIGIESAKYFVGTPASFWSGHIADGYMEVAFEDAEKTMLYDFFNTCTMGSTRASDTVLAEIIDEELSYYYDGVKTLEEVSAIIQSRVWIYLNE